MLAVCPLRAVRLIAVLEVLRVHLQDALLEAKAILSVSTCWGLLVTGISQDNALACSE